MTTLKMENLSPFGQLAVKLDGDFMELERVGGQIERLELDTDSGLERALKLLGQYAELGQNVAGGIQQFAVVLQQARENAERSAAVVSERAPLIQARKEERDRIEEKIGQLGARVREVTGNLAGMQNPEELTELHSRLGGFVEEAKAIQDLAREANFKGAERNAQSLYGTLQAAQRKLGSVLPPRH